MECSNLQQIVRNNEDDSPKIEMSVKFRSSSRRKIDFSTDDGNIKFLIYTPKFVTGYLTTVTLSSMLSMSY